MKVSRGVCLRAVSVLATSYGSHTHHCMPGLAQQKRDETTWEGSVRVALGEGDRLVGMPLVTTPEDCIHTSLSENTCGGGRRGGKTSITSWSASIILHVTT